jgi:fructose-1,6-bisphosphatase/inositol monophosphatase family enzyme
MTPDALLDLFDATAVAVRDAVAAIDRAELRGRTDRSGQYALDVVADDAACAVLSKAPIRILSEESGVHERDGAAITVVIDPVDGSTNCSRGIAYWATSLCAVDADGAVASMVVNQATGDRTIATRGGGATRNGLPLQASNVTRISDAVIDLAGFPKRLPKGKQARVMGSIALVLCEIAAGGIDAHLDSGPWTGPWDYLGGYLACLEAGATVRDFGRAPLVATEFEARRQIIAAGTAELADALEAGLK